MSGEWDLVLCAGRARWEADQLADVTVSPRKSGKTAVLNAAIIKELMLGNTVEYFSNGKWHMMAGSNEGTALVQGARCPCGGALRQLFFFDGVACCVCTQCDKDGEIMRDDTYVWVGEMPDNGVIIAEGTDEGKALVMAAMIKIWQGAATLRRVPISEADPLKTANLRNADTCRFCRHHSHMSEHCTNHNTSVNWSQTCDDWSERNE